MFTFVFIDLLLVGMALATHANGWIPVTRPMSFNQMNTRFMETRRASGWKPFHSNEQSNSEKNNAMLIMTPVQTQPNQNGFNVPEIKKVESINVLVRNDSENSTVLPPPEDINEDSLTSRTQNNSLYRINPIDGIQTRNIKTDIYRRAPKHLWKPNSTQDLLSSDLITPDPNIKKDETKDTIIVNNVTNNSYEVTEPTNVQELTYKSHAMRNELTNKFFNILSKYNINTQDMLKNYDKSKHHQNKRIPVYPSRESPGSLVPFRYNSLNHLSLDPVLAVFLSNYGYYLQGFFGMPNKYRNLYGYSASNNIHNNKPFGSYKIYSDTDSSN